MTAAAALWLAALASDARPPVEDERRGLTIVWVDVDGGAATLVVSPAGESLLVDAGWPGGRDARRIAEAARAEGVTRIDHFVLTHFHTDHWGGVAELAELLPIERFYDRGLPAQDDPKADRRIRPELRAAWLEATKGKAVELSPGDLLPLAGVRVEVLVGDGSTAGEPEGAPQSRACTARPPHEARPDDDSENALSLGLLLTLGDFQFLDLGDLTWNVEHKLVCPEDRIGPVDVFQVTHHGHDSSNHPALLAAARPTVAVIQNGPEKGATEPVLKALRATPGLCDVFQLHRNPDSEDNAPSELVANDVEDCRGASIRLELDPSGESYRVEVPSKGTRRTYAVRRD